IRTVATEIVQAVQSTVNGNDWLSRETKTSLRTKIQRTQIQVGYPEYILNDSYINNLSET
ncbi:neprilysin, partial [Biomphalaria pfeifferi]